MTDKSRPFTVLVEGNIGCGKTTLLQHFSKFPDVEVLAEPVKKWRDLNGYNLLDLMYKDPERWSMPFQSYVQQTMLEIHLKQTDRPVKLIERSIFSARYCFVENLYRTGKMEGSELEVLSHWFDFLTTSPELDLQVDLIIYLKTTPQKALERIQKRNRGEETGIPISYLEELHQLHEDWLFKNKFPVPAPVVTIDATKGMEEMIEEYEKYQDLILKADRESIDSISVSTRDLNLTSSAPALPEIVTPAAV